MTLEFLVAVKVWAVEIASTVVFLVFVYAVARHEISNVLNKVGSGRLAGRGRKVA